MIDSQPHLWSDFDNLAVNARRRYRRGSIRGVSGYREFLKGLGASGVEFGGVVSSKPDSPPSRRAIMRSMARLGLLDFVDKSQLVLAGSENAKAKRIADESTGSTVGVLADRPDKLGTTIVDSLINLEEPGTEARHSIVMGVADHPEANDSTRRLVELTAPFDDRLDISGSCYNGVVIEGSGFLLNVVQLQPYSEYAGQEFADRVTVMNFDASIR